MGMEEQPKVPSPSPSPEFSPLAISEQLTPLPRYQAARTTNVDFDGLLPAPIKLHEDLKSGCGGQIWQAGMVLAKHMLRYEMESLRGARILELGAGGGLVGLAVAAAASAIEPTFTEPLFITDLNEMFELMGHNIALNKMNSRVKPLVLNWGEPLPQEVADFKPNVILAADCVYFEPAFPLLRKTLEDLLAQFPDATVYFCFKKRRRADMQFLKKAKKTFVVEELENRDRLIFSRDGLFLYTFRSKQRSSPQAQ
ncbi:uncharacterized protein MKZ38_001063 [Zalerion maritima]|uniref:Protein-lysine N-methyltransferase EFM6 n=1 Tax=Zalerion maritima TaxID=339359 RepID=A0AAD5RRY1_9PEZI|nr:uncharacterized protein MKZ38_001063 [Zalerion maritima]